MSGTGSFVGNQVPWELLAELHLMESAIGADSLLDFIPRVTKQWVAPRHLKPIAELFTRAEYGPVRACVSVPPRHGKTELLIHAIPWWLHRHPEQTCVYVSYSGDLANDKSKRSLDISKESGLPLRPDMQRGTQWRTYAGGGMLATGIGGPLTGYGANLLIIDDPIKNREEAESMTVRQRNWEWFTSTALTRVEPGGSVIVVHTRWHDDDLIGRLQKEQGQKWEYVNLPALSETDGTALWPTRWPADSLNLRRKEVGEYDWWSLFMGQPRPKGGKLFKDPTYYDYPNVQGTRFLICCDPAATGATRADHSAVVVGSAWRDKQGLVHIDILDVHRVQVEMPVLAQYLVAVQERWQAPIAVEAVGGFKAVPQMLRQLSKTLRILELNAVGDKFTRSLPAAAAWNDGRIRVPKHAPWLGAYLRELTSFTGVSDAQDDQVDATAHLYATFAKLLPASIGGQQQPREAQWAPFG